ncbi:bifunctional riboflavin kinase/FAD synthetase [bacterium]|nr:bifunctional riboflavin kinase/FAD synthetase [bacterium]MCI0605999.1 bifunctional riboflavin kinase/FAD synthetase [bacterium]
MVVHGGFENWKSIGKTAVSLGNYDGVHVGHRVILEKTIDLARNSHIPGVAVTFDPVPKKILQPQTAPPLIQTLQQRLNKLESLGLEHTIVVPFSSKFAKKSPEEFVQEFLIDKLRVQYFVVGENFSFGHQKRGDLSLLRKMGEANDFHVMGIPEVHRNGIRISSSQIREFIQQGRMEEATDFLGDPFALVGTIVEGEHLGGKIGIPTANLDFENEIVPAKGVYVCRAGIESQSLCAVTNVGVRPTFQGKKLTVEAHLLDFSGDLYGSRMELHFFHKLRDEMRFAGVEELKAQIQLDIQNAQSYRGNTCGASTLPAKTI